jgi:hypothetical protein
MNLENNMRFQTVRLFICLNLHVFPEATGALYVNLTLTSIHVENTRINMFINCM